MRIGIVMDGMNVDGFTKEDFVDVANFVRLLTSKCGAVLDENKQYAYTKSGSLLTLQYMDINDKLFVELCAEAQANINARKPDDYIYIPNEYASLTWGQVKKEAIRTSFRELHEKLRLYQAKEDIVGHFSEKLIPYEVFRRQVRGAMGTDIDDSTLFVDVMNIRRLW